MTLFNSYENTKRGITAALGDALHDDQIVTIESTHEEVHEGSFHYADKISSSLNADGFIDFMLITGAGEYLHSFLNVIGTGEFEIQSWEDTTCTGNGTEIPLLCRNRNCTTLPLTKLYHTVNTPVTTGATLIRSGRFGSGKSSIGDARSENELVLKPNTKYYIKCISKATSVYMTTHFNFYIHTTAG